MKKTYEVKRDFWVGECNIQLKCGDEVQYDDSTSYLFVNGDKHEARNLKAAIKAKWLVPSDGEYPELDGPLGETEEEAMERRRKERFAQKAKKDQTVEGLLKDEREVGVIKDENEMMKVLNAEPVASEKFKNKKRVEVIEDDTKVVGSAKYDDSETKAIKKALNQEEKEKTDPQEFKVFTDHYDAEAIHVGKYNDGSNESALKGWSTLHWTKKAEVIKTASDKTFLTQLKGLETSNKIKERIEKRLEDL